MKKLARRLAALVCALSLCLTCASALSLEQAVGLMELFYVDDLPAAAYEATTLDELFDAIGDPYTYYMNAEQNKSFLDQVEQETSFSGIGASIEYTAEGIRVISVLDGSGAQDAGFQSGDCIIAIEGQSCVPAGEAHRALILGEAGTWVTLTVRDRDGVVRERRVERRSLTIRNTKFSVDGKVGYIDCDSFGSQTEDHFVEGIRKYDDQIALWVVDLRDNLGGYADAAVGTLGAVSGPGVKLHYRDAHGNSMYTTYHFAALTHSPLIVLVDGYSASASEIFAGGVRAEKAGIVVGSRTYGKGTAQIVLDKDRYPELFDDDSVKVSAYRFYCADGCTTDHIGVLPTLLVHDGYADEVAALLSAPMPQGSEALSIWLNDNWFFVSIDALHDPKNASAVSELFSALAPGVSVYCYIDDVEVPLPPSLAAEYYGVSYERRSFSDIASSPYVTQIETLAVYGLLDGDGTGRFHPGDKLTRAELATMLANALNVISNRDAGFSDVAPGRWFTPSVNAMALLGFMEGVGGGRFDPNGTLTQEQLITVMGRLARFLNFHADSFARELSEDDLASYAKFRPWAREAAGVLASYNRNMYYADLSAVSPDAPATREQAAATLCNILKGLGVLSY